MIAWILWGIVVAETGMIIQLIFMLKEMSDKIKRLRKKLEEKGEID